MMHFYRDSDQPCEGFQMLSRFNVNFSSGKLMRKLGIAQLLQKDREMESACRMVFSEHLVSFFPNNRAIIQYRNTLNMQS
jgi:hypothetical protein